MEIEILMPSLSPTMEEGSLAKWYVKPGDSVQPGDIIADIETDKALMEYESAEEGVIKELLVTEGSENIKINTAIAIIETENIGYEVNYHLYELLEDKSYLETANNQIQEKVDAMDDELKEKFLNYPIPKQIQSAVIM